MKTQARVVVIGGGAIGVSVAYHLAKYGWSDVVLIEKHELTSGSTWMAAGNCSFFHGNYYCTQVNMKSIEIYQQLEAETGQSVGWHTTGSIRTGASPRSRSWFSWALNCMPVLRARAMAMISTFLDDRRSLSRSFAVT